MKKLFFVLLILVFASSASATVYRWVDEGGAVNYADDYGTVPPEYRNKAEEVSIPKTGRSTLSQATSGKIAAGTQSGEQATQPPPIAQTLTREGDFAIKLAEALKIGNAKSEAEAESMLASAGITPKNGWIADYPMTPDIIAELEKSVGEAADSRKLALGKNEALKTLRTVAVEHELPIIAEGPDEYTESPSPTTPQYTEQSVINDYYDTEGPPVVTYYPPPPDYYYMYAWVPSPFWYTGFLFPGFFILHDFHRVIHRHGHPCVITNHIRDHRTGGISVIHPGRRHAGSIFGSKETPHRRGFNSAEARKGARSIFDRSRGRMGPGNTSMPRGPNNTRPVYSRPGRGPERRTEHRGSQPSGLNGRNGYRGRPPGVNRRTDRVNGMNFQRPSVGGTRSFSPPSRGPSRGIERFSSPSPKGGSQHFGSSHTGGRDFSASHRGGNHSGGFGRGNSRF
jgi:hypothetical protein